MYPYYYQTPYFFNPHEIYHQQRFGGQQFGGQGEYGGLVGQIIDANIPGILPQQSRVFIHRVSRDFQGNERVTIVYPNPDPAIGICKVSATTVNANQIQHIQSFL